MILAVNNDYFLVRFQVLTAASMEFRVFWDILPYSQIDADIDLTTWLYIPEDSERLFPWSALTS
jgi:hypothetical protein